MDASTLDSHLTPPSGRGPQTPHAGELFARIDACLLIAHHRRTRDVIGLLRTDAGVLLAHALPRIDARPTAIPCPVCLAAGRLEHAVDRGAGATPRVLGLDCPLCLGVGAAEFGYSNFAACFQSADFHDVAAFTDEAGATVAHVRQPTDRLVTLAEAHAEMTRSAT